MSFPCGPGCSHCCKLPVTATMPEATLAALHIMDCMPKRIPETIARIRQWQAWEESELPKLADAGIDRMSIFKLHGPGCPFLTDGVCMIYPARPMGCRVHFSSDASRCSPEAGKGQSFELFPEDDIFDYVRSVCLEYRESFTRAGVEFELLLGPFGGLVADCLEGDE